MAIYSSNIETRGAPGKQIHHGMSGSGGGAGGSIQVLTNSIKGDGVFDTSGGDGSHGGGGGGAGGRLVVHFLHNYNANDKFVNSYDWHGKLLQQGGKAGVISPKHNQVTDLKGEDGQFGISS